MKQYLMSLAGKIVFVFLALIIVTACAPTEKPTGQIFLYGEAHGIERIMNRQLEIWHDYYHNHNMRHLFIEFTFPTAEVLNMWMR
ncbi:MAG: hypothetical protein FWC97_09350, partial [Treponema sp.]|nr:hypothetical protein [Treponema sp.]